MYCYTGFEFFLGKGKGERGRGADQDLRTSRSAVLSRPSRHLWNFFTFTVSPLARWQIMIYSVA